MFSKFDMENFRYLEGINSRRNFKISGFKTGFVNNKNITTLIFSWEEPYYCKLSKKYTYFPHSQIVNFSGEYDKDLMNLLTNQFRFVPWTTSFKLRDFLKTWYKSLTSTITFSLFKLLNKTKKG